jgi:class 3 adenylate cyclase
MSADVEQLRSAAGVPAAAVDAFVDLVDHGSDREIVRINPVLFARDRGLDRRAVLDMLLHARKLGLVTMEWLFVCHGCGEIVESLASLTSASSHFFCDVCSTDRVTDMSEFVEVAFTVTPSVRRSAFHDPWSLDPESHFLEHRFGSSAMVDGRSVSQHLRDQLVTCCYVAPGETITIDADAEPEYLWFTNGPAITVRPTHTTDLRTFEFEYSGTHTAGFRAEIDAGPVRTFFTNRTSHPYALMVVNLPGEYELERGDFLSGADVLSNQTFLDLFDTETVVAAEGLGVTRLAFLFTDLEGSTAMYDRLGDMRAFDLVRMHFGFLRESVVQHSGALVKTIGDAVMATFVDPGDALCAALEMLTRVDRFNEEQGDELVRLKIGIHWGACLAVTLNDRLDYFGQTVNLAARVQALALSNEIVISDDVAVQPAVGELIRGLEATSVIVQVKGIESDIAVHRLKPHRSKVASSG